MKIKVYKGFNIDFLRGIPETPLPNKPIEDKVNCFKLNSGNQNMMSELLELLNTENKCAWMTYEEYEISYKYINPFVEDGKVHIEIIKNNLYPDIYPSPLPISDDIISLYENPEKIGSSTKQIEALDKCYASIEKCGGVTFISYHDLESSNGAHIEEVENFFPSNIEIIDIPQKDSYTVEISNNLFNYLEKITEIKKYNLKEISYKLISHNGQEEHIFESFKAFLLHNGINKLYKAAPEREAIKWQGQISKELKEIAEDLLKIENFQFRSMQFYKNPDESKETEQYSQLSIMQNIIQEAEKAHNAKHYRDIFITAPTGSGKSIIFQLPAIYLARKYHQLTLIIEPLKALQEDQKQILDHAGFKKVEYLNSDIKYINPTEKEEILRRIKEGATDILYVNPEMLVNSSISNLVGEREIGLVVVDEAHTVSAWGNSFRPDYGYLGSYLKQMHKIKGSFPIFACTATAIYGGKDDTVYSIIQSLNMTDPIIKIGPVRRDNIKFEINDCNFDNKKEYACKKAQMLAKRLEEWENKKEKTIIYCPYRSIAAEMYKGDNGCYGDFSCLEKFKPYSALYTGSSSSGIEKKEQTQKKIKAAEEFRNGEKNIMYATKAFGMGIDIPDIKNIYHYAVTGGLEDYVQEIGRCARKGKEENGKAVIDFSTTDLQYPVTLFAISRITNNQIETCLSTILYAYDLHKKHHDQWKPFYINVQAFRGTFPEADIDQLLNYVQRALLMLEREKDRKPILVSKPFTLFSKWYAVIENDHKNDFDSKYFIYETRGRHNYMLESGVQISDRGDIYSVNLKRMWEDKYAQNMSFKQFQFIFFNYKEKILGDKAKFIKDRAKVNIKARKGKLVEAFSKTATLIYALCHIIKMLKSENQSFTKSEFKNALNYYASTHPDISLNETTITAISNSFVEIMDKNHECFEINEDEVGEEIYTFKRGSSIEYLKKKMLNKGTAFKQNNFAKEDLEKSEKILFMPIYPKINQGREVNEFDYLNLMSLFNLTVFEMLGGDSPVIQVRMTNPELARKIVDGEVIYRNQSAYERIRKHYRSMEIVHYFFENSNFTSNEQRWDFIEDYFLGVDIEDKYIQATKPENKIEKQVTLSHLISDGQKVNAKTWDELINKMFKQRNNKYIPACRILKKSKAPLPDYFLAKVKLDESDKSPELNAIFIFQKYKFLIVAENTYYNFIKQAMSNGLKVIKITDLDTAQQAFPWK